MLISEEPEYSKLSARLLTNFIDKEVSQQNIYSFSQSIQKGFDLGIIEEQTADFVRKNSQQLDQAILVFTAQELATLLLLEIFPGPAPCKTLTIPP